MKPNQTLSTLQLIEKYHDLKDIDREILQLFSVIYEPVPRTTFCECWNELKRNAAGDRKFTTASIKSYITRLKTGKFLEESKAGLYCRNAIAEVATREALRTKSFDEFVQVAQAKIPVSVLRNGFRRFRNKAQVLRELRISLYNHDLKTIGTLLEDYNRYTILSERVDFAVFLLRVCNDPFDPEFVRSLPIELFNIVEKAILSNSILQLKPADEAYALFRERCLSETPLAEPGLYGFCAEQMFLRGQPQLVPQLIARMPPEASVLSPILSGWLRFVEGDNERAIAYFTAGLKGFRRMTGKRQVFFPGIEGVIFILALMKNGTRDREAEEYTGLVLRQSQHWLKNIYLRLQLTIQIRRGHLAQMETLSVLPVPAHTETHSVETFCSALCLYWTHAEQAKQVLPRVLEPLYANANDAGIRWIALEAAELLSRLQPDSNYTNDARRLRAELNIPPLVDVIAVKESWELCLNALVNLEREPEAKPKIETDQRMVWFMTYVHGYCTFQPREQKMNAKGGWSAGRNIALKRLAHSPGDFPYMTPQDLRACTHLQSYMQGYYGQVSYEFDETTILELIDHPLVFWEGTPEVRVEIVGGEPELLVKQHGQERLILEFNPPLPTGKDLLILKESPTRLKAIEIKPGHRRIAQIIGAQNHLEVPAIAKEQVLTAIQAVSNIVTVQSDIGGGVGSAEAVPADSKPYVHLLPAGEGLKVSILCRPFAVGGPYYRPGSGGETVLAEIDGKRLQTRRDLAEEKQRAEAIIAACPTLARQDEQDGERLAIDPEACLDLLSELQGLGEDIVVQWPQGEKMRVTSPVDFRHMKFAIRSQQDWFALQGELQLDDNHVLDMQRLMTLLSETPSRFLPLGDGQFLTLTQEFRKRLDELRLFSEKHGKGQRLHPLAAIALEDFMSEVEDLEADDRWKAHIARLKEMQTLEPELPSTLQAELRNYQIEGFQWLARLAHWGVGACLADDMGLGKTLQTLAAILTRAPEGPTLIVAPTSVCANWASEAQKFAPTLRLLQFGGSDRQKLLESLQPFDMLVCSYGLLQQTEVGEMLAKVQWQTIVLDEAQSIKNFATKRSQAAMNLQGGFKIIVTGTPIENHLGELWNLFRFINPGLLGSLDNFNQRFAFPIERWQDKQARQKLKKLIQPFLLRRTKNQVLEELPSRTEITLQVELSDAEKNFYEALRRQALEKLTQSDAPEGQKRLQVLAEIMKLRRACCNTQLVAPDMQLPSAKLQLFGEVLAELLENRHKALVFSQFVDHLHILRDYLDAQQIAYQYLDGSTAAGDRKKRVDAFQAGKGDVFLISLKAGGTGLNLTAADYVIHMDPWWNPAVEDQASDRAHRIGQKRPVTIYRFVAKGTIEEKIVDLHQHKRDLADTLLEGADIGGKVTTEALLQMLHE